MFDIKQTRNQEDYKEFELYMNGHLLFNVFRFFKYSNRGWEVQCHLPVSKPKLIEFIKANYEIEKVYLKNESFEDFVGMLYKFVTTGDYLVEESKFITYSRVKVVEIFTHMALEGKLKELIVHTYSKAFTDLIVILKELALSTGERDIQKLFSEVDNIINKEVESISTPK